MPEVDSEFLKSLEKQLEPRHRQERRRTGLLGLLILLAIVVVVGGGLYYMLMYDPYAGRTLPPELPPPKAVAQMPVSEKAKETGKTYYESHPEIQSALADYARRLSKGQLDLQALGPQFQPVANFSWEKWYYDTMPVREGFKTHRDPQPTAHSYTEERPMITYTITADDQWGAWGVGIKYAAALGIDIQNPANQEIASLIAAYVWLQSDSRLLYDKANYFNDKGEFDPKRPKENINLLHAGDQIRFPHLSADALKELGQNPHKYLEGTMPPSNQPPPAPAATPTTS